MASQVPVAFKLNAYALPSDTRFCEILDLATEAETLGFDGVYLIDHLFMPTEQLTGFSAELEADKPFFPDTWALLSALAARTSRVRIGPQVTPLMRMHPVDIARAGATIDWISGGRFVLQVGMGWNAAEYRAFGLPYLESVRRRSRRLSEGIRLIDTLWRSSTPATFAGDYFALDDAPLWPKPLQRPRPPIWVGGSGVHARRVAAELGDGWTPAAPHYEGMTPEAYRAGVTEIRSTAAGLGRSPRDITAAGFFFVVIDETLERAIEAAGTLLRRDIWRNLSVRELAERGIAFIGTADQILSSMLRYVDAGLEYFTVAFMPIRGYESTARQMRLFQPVLRSLLGS